MIIIIQLQGPATASVGVGHGADVGGVEMSTDCLYFVVGRAGVYTTLGELSVIRTTHKKGRHSSRLKACKYTLIFRTAGNMLYWT